MFNIISTSLFIKKVLLKIPYRFPNNNSFYNYTFFIICCIKCFLYIIKKKINDFPFKQKNIIFINKL